MRETPEEYANRVLYTALQTHEPLRLHDQVFQKQDTSTTLKKSEAPKSVEPDWVEKALQEHGLAPSTIKPNVNLSKSKDWVDEAINRFYSEGKV